MIISRQQLQDNENRTLASYGMRSSDSKGRAFPEEERAYRTPFQRDRERILHTTAFRRLKHKTQVFIISEGDYYRTRLTHTLEVAEVGRTISRALGANEDLVESICLAHDLGHPPFGHAGESTLSKLMQEHGGFDHNRQSFRIVTELENRYPDFQGLNLTWEVREGIVKHETENGVADAINFDPEKRGHLEAQIANAADELAYSAHDLDDGLRSALITPEQLDGLALWETLLERLDLEPSRLSELNRHRIIRRLIGLEVSDLIGETSDQIERSGIETTEDIQLHSSNIVGFSVAMQEMNRELKSFLYQNLYRHPRVYRMQIKAERMLQNLFESYTQNPEILPREVQARAHHGDFYRVVTDYLAGMTDRFALQDHARLFDPTVGP